MLTDELIAHLDNILSDLDDYFIVSRYTGFLAVSSVTVLELAMKTIFLDFAKVKHKILLTFCENYFSQINGRIKLKTIQDEYISKFGQKYNKRFKDNLQKIENMELQVNRRSIKSSYGNLIEWRHKFVHEGEIASNASYGEVKNGFECGKLIMNCLSESMRR
jgi:hypothetical protein